MQKVLHQVTEGSFGVVRARSHLVSTCYMPRSICKMFRISHPVGSSVFLLVASLLHSFLGGIILGQILYIFFAF